VIRQVCPQGPSGGWRSRGSLGKSGMLNGNEAVDGPRRYQGKLVTFVAV
jgi:hypothetical protein